MAGLTGLLIEFYVHNSPVPEETKSKGKADNWTFYLTAKILHDQIHIYFQDLPHSLITPRKAGSRRQHTHTLRLADTTGLCWVFWSQARKLNLLLNKLIGKMPLQIALTLNESRLSRSERRTGATWARMALKRQGKEKQKYTLVCNTNTCSFRGIQDLALG